MLVGSLYVDVKVAADEAITASRCSGTSSRLGPIARTAERRVNISVLSNEPPLQTHYLTRLF